MHLTGGTGQYTTIEALLSQWEAQAFRCFRLPLPLPPLSQWEAQAPSAASAFRCPCLPLSQWEAQAFRCFRLPLPLPPTISVGGLGFFRLASGPCLPLTQWEAWAPCTHHVWLHKVLRETWTINCYKKGLSNELLQNEHRMPQPSLHA